MNTVTLRLREQEDEEHKVKHAEAQDHAEFEFNLNDSHWDVWSARYQRGGPASTPQLNFRADQAAARVKAENPSLDTDKLYIRTVPWNTTAKLPTDLGGTGPRPASVLLGHNGEHQVTLHEVNGQPSNAVFLFDKRMQQGRWESLPYAAAPTLHQVGNLVIKSAKLADGSLDVARYVPESSDRNLSAPEVQVAFSDAGYQSGDMYICKALFVDTHNDDTFCSEPVIVGEIPQAPIALPLPKLTPASVYGFEVCIEKRRAGQAIDLQWWRSDYIYFDQTGLGTETEEADSKLQFHYNVARYTSEPEDTELAEAKVQVFDGARNEIANVVAPTQTTFNAQGIGEEITVDLPTMSENAVAGEWRSVAVGIDNAASHYRSHHSKRLLPKNRVLFNYEVLVINGPGLKTSIDPTGGNSRYNWSKSKRLLHILPGQLPPGTGAVNGANFQLGLLTFREVPRSNDAITTWKYLQRRANITMDHKKDRGYNPIMIYASTHGTRDGIEVGNSEDSVIYDADAEDGYSYASIISSSFRGTLSGGDYKLGSSPGDMLNGVRFFHMAGCQTSGRAELRSYAPERHLKRNYIPDARDIAQSVTAGGYSRNSIGYKKDLFYLSERDQNWYCSFFRAGLNHKYNDNAYNSMLGTEKSFGRWLKDSQVRRWGNYERWVLSNNAPLIDPVGGDQ